MTENERHIVEVAGQLFARYGISKTTMVDIARAAGVSRQTVYNAFSGKDDVLGAFVALHLEEKRATLNALWQQSSDFGEKLDHLFEELPLGWYDLVEAAPHAAELINGMNRTSQEEMAAFTKAIVEMLTQQIDAIGVPDAVTAADLADYIYSTAIHAKYGAKDKNELIRKLSVLKASVLALIA